MKFLHADSSRDGLLQQLNDPFSTRAIVILGVPITLVLLGKILVGVIVIGIALYLLYKLIQLIKGSGATATPSRLQVSHDDAVIADSAGKQITAQVTRNIDGNPLPAIDIKFEILPGSTPGITSSVNGSTIATAPTDTYGMATVTVIGTAQGSDVCRVSLALGGTSVDVPYETAP